MKKRIEPEIQKALEDNRLLITTPFDESVKSITAQSSRTRNELMAKIADEIFVAHASPGGNVDKLIHKCLPGGRQISNLRYG